jgi:LysR family hydrogen peroxide-inducible transcriptional activator
VEVHQLRYFVTAARVGTITRAAESLYVSQPALSEQIRKLERELGTALFERLGRRLVLTAAGEALLPHAERALFEVEEGRMRVREVLGLRRGRVAVGVLPSVAGTLLPSALAGFRHGHPGVDLVLREEPSAISERMVHAGELDLAVIRLPATRRDLEHRTLATEHMVALVAPDHRLAGRTTVKALELSDEDFVAVKAGNGMRELMVDVCRPAGFEPRIAVETSQLSSVLAMVGAGMGITILSQMAAANTRHQLLIEDQWAKRELAVCYRPRQPLSPAALAFVDLLLDAGRRAADGRGGGGERYPRA